MMNLELLSWVGEHTRLRYFKVRDITLRWSSKWTPWILFLETLRKAEALGRAGDGSEREISSFILFYNSVNFSQKLAFVNHASYTSGLIQYLNCSGKLFKNCFCIYILWREKGQSWKSTTNCDWHKWKKNKPERNNEKPHGRNCKKTEPSSSSAICNYVRMKNYRG